MSSNNGFLYFIGLCFVGGSISYLTDNTAYGTLAFGVGLLIAAMLNYLDNKK